MIGFLAASVSGWWVRWTKWLQAQLFVPLLVFSSALLILCFQYLAWNIELTTHFLPLEAYMSPLCLLVGLYVSRIMQKLQNFSTFSTFLLNLVERWGLESLMHFQTKRGIHSFFWHFLWLYFTANKSFTLPDSFLKNWTIKCRIVSWRYVVSWVLF